MYCYSVQLFRGYIQFLSMCPWSRSHCRSVKDLNWTWNHFGLSLCDRLGPVQVFWLFSSTVQFNTCKSSTPLCWRLVAGLGWNPALWPLGSRTPAILCCGRGGNRKWIVGRIIGNVDWSPLRLPDLYRSSVSNWSCFLFINIRPRLASLLITLLSGLTLRLGLIEWPMVTMLIDWVKITLTWVTHSVIKLSSDLFDTRCGDGSKNLKTDLRELLLWWCTTGCRHFTEEKNLGCHKAKLQWPGREEVCLFWFGEQHKTTCWKSINITPTHPDTTQRFKQQI